MLTDRFADALQYSWELHRHQHRKGVGVPYISHLMSVSALVLEAGGGEDEAIAALLHDAVEDSGGLKTYDEIVHRFGKRIAEIVFACSDSHTQPRPPWRRRKEAFLDRLTSAEPAVLLIVAADKLHNLTSILLDYRRVGEKLWNRFTGKRRGTLWYYSRTVSILADRYPSPLTDRLIRTWAELQDELAGQ